MAVECTGVALSPPEGFSCDEVMFSMSAPLPTPVARTLHRTVQVRPNMLVHRRKVRGNSTIETLAGATSAEVAASVAGLKDLRSRAETFKDGTPGVLLSFDYTSRGLNVRQYQAMRLDSGLFTTITLTVDANTLTEDTEGSYLACLLGVTAEASLGF